MTTAYPHSSIPWATLTNNASMSKILAHFIVVVLYASSDEYAVYANAVGLLMYAFVLWSRLFKSWIFDLAIGKQLLA